MKLTDDEIVAALLSYVTNAEAAEALGITESHLYKRMRSESFKAKYKSAQDYLIRTCLDTAKRALTESIFTMVEIMQDANNAPQVRLNAAVALRDSITKLQSAAGAERDASLCWW